MISWELIRVFLLIQFTFDPKFLSLSAYSQNAEAWLLVFSRELERLESEHDNIIQSAFNLPQNARKSPAEIKQILAEATKMNELVKQSFLHVI